MLEESCGEHMATEPVCRDTGSSKNHEVFPFADLLNRQWVSHGTNQQGELPLMKDVFSWGDLFLMKGSGAPIDISNEKTLQCNQSNFQRRSYGSEKQTESGAFGTGLVWQSSVFPQERYSSRLKMGGTLQADCSPNQKATGGTFGLEHSSLLLAKRSWNNTGDIDDDVSLQHWLKSGRNEKVASMSNYLRQKLKIDARELRSSKFIRAGSDLSPDAHVCEVFHREHRKKRKLLTSRESSQLLPQSSAALCPLSSSTHHTRFYPQSHHHSPSLTIKQPMLAQQEHASRGLPFANLEPQKLLTEFLKARLLSLKGVKIPFCDDELDVSELPKFGKCKPWRRFTGKRQRKSCSRTCSLSDLSRRKSGPSRAVNTKAECKSIRKCLLEVQKKKKTEAMFFSTEAMACSKTNHSHHVGGCLKDTDFSIDKVAANRQTARKGLRISNSETREKDGHFGSPSWRLQIQSLSQKYRPKMLQDLIGQSIVARALSNAISKDKVAPVYLFQGSHGTGKTSAARIFAMALNCVTPEESKKPCGLCNECTALMSGKTSCVWELDAASHNGIGYMHELIESIKCATPGPRYKIVIIDDCHMFSSKTWSALVKLLEEPPSKAVFILITTEPDKLPLTIMSRCQRFNFLRIKHSDIVNRLDHIAKLENIIIESGALSLIAAKSDGSLRDAETVLDQVSLLEQRTTLATIHKLVGSVSDDKLMSLLGLALCSDMVRTVQKTREIIDFGVDPSDLLSLLATLITDILGGTYVPMRTCKTEGSLSTDAMSDLEMVRLRNALRILSEAERQVKTVPLYRTTWLTAALLQLGPRLRCKSKAKILSKSFAKASPTTQLTFQRAKVTKRRVCNQGRGGLKCQVSEAAVKDKPMKSLANEEIHVHLKNPANVASLWSSVLKCCRPVSLRHLLQNHGKLLALTFSAVDIVANVVFEKPVYKNTAEMYRSSITNSFKNFLGPSAEVQFSLVSDLQGAGLSSFPADIASYNQRTCKPSAGCEGEGHSIQRESYDFKSSKTPCSLQIVGRPLLNRSSCLPVFRCSSHSLCGTEPTIRQHNGSSTANPLATKGHSQMQLSSKALGGSDNSQKHFSKKGSGRKFRRLMVKSHAKKFLCNFVLASLLNANSTKDCCSPAEHYF